MVRPRLPGRVVSGTKARLAVRGQGGSRSEAGEGWKDVYMAPGLMKGSVATLHTRGAGHPGGWVCDAMYDVYARR